jgi:hypothetical protein
MLTYLLANRRSTLAFRKLNGVKLNLISKIELYLLDKYYNIVDEKPKGFSKEARNALILLRKRLR